MGEVLPLKGIFSGSTVTGLGEFRTATADVIGVAHGGTGLATVATDRILTGNGTSAMTAEANLTFNGSTLAVTGDTTISGNLTVQGNFTETVKIATEDPIIALNTAASGSNSNDAGFVIERGSDANVALIWDESDSGTSGGIFNFITTTDTGIVSGDINVSGQADIKTGNITSTGNLVVAGTVTGVTNLTMSGNLTGATNVQLTGTLQFDSGQTVSAISNDGTFTAGAATSLVTESAIKTHVSAQASAFAIALG